MQTTEWVNAEDIASGDRISTTNGMREVLAIYAITSERLRIEIQDAGSATGKSDLRANRFDPIHRFKRE